MKSFSREEREALRKSGLFDERYYLEQYPDVKMLGMDPVEHYLWIGTTLGRNPSAQFSTCKYLDWHKDVAAANINPLLHYVKAGRSEGRRIAPPELPDSAKDRVTCQRIINRRLAYWDQKEEAAFIRRLNEATSPPSDEFVSIIMPTWNRGNCIADAIRSVMQQTHKNWELIIVDDGSTDDTSSVIKKFNNEKIVYIQHARSEGVSKARNTGLRAARGDWVFFLDSDNSWHPHCLETMLRFVAYHSLSAAYCGAEIRGDDNGIKGYLFAEFDFESCVKENFIDLNTFCVRADIAKIEFDETLRRLVDWDYILRISAKTRMRAAKFLGVTYYDGNQHNRITRNEYRTRAELEVMMERIRQKAKDEILRNVNRERQSRGLIAVVFHVYHTEYAEECLSYLRNIGQPFDLYVTSHYSDNSDAIVKIKQAFPDAMTFQFPNVGFDIGPFLSLLSTLCNYSFVCKIHAKRNVAPWGATWRTTMLEGLLGSSQLVDRIISELQADHRLTSAGPGVFYKDIAARSSPATQLRLGDLAGARGFGGALKQGCGFFAGTSFWMKPQLLYGLARYACDELSYSAQYKKDDLVEHALERAFGIELLSNGGLVGLTDARPGRPFAFEKTSAQTGTCREAITVTLDRLHKSAGKGVLRYYPDYTSTNAYQRLLYSGFADYDVKAGNLAECLELQKKVGGVVLHLHWINALFGSAKTKVDAEKIASGYIEQLREFVSRGGRVIWTVHNVVSHEPKYFDEEVRLSRALTELAEWIHVHHASVADATKPYYELPPHKILVAEHGNYIGTLPDEATREQARSELGIPAGQTVFLFLGQVRGYKGIDELLRAFAELSSGNRDCWLVIAGKLLGLTEAEIEGKLSGIPNVLFRPGHVPDEEMQIYLKSADVMVLPYRKVLTSGSVFLALSFGLPVICPRAGLLSHIVEQGENGFLYDAGEPDGLLRAMQAFIDASGSEVERMRASALETAKSYRWEETSAKLRRHIEGTDFGRAMWTDIEGSRRVWFVRGDLEALKRRRCIAIVLHYQNRDDTRECIERLRKQGSDVGILLISNAETLDDIRLMQETFPDIVLVQSEDNVGYAAANNFGLWLCRRSQAEFFWIVNPDIVVPDGYYDQLVTRIEGWPDHAFFASTIVPSHQPEKAIFCGGEVRLDQGARPGHLHMGRPVTELPAEPFECDYLTGANIFGRRSALAAAGYMPEHYFLYFEETDWFLDMRSKGTLRTPLVFPDMHIQNHKRSENGLVPSRYYIYYFIRNSLIFGRKFASRQMPDCIREARKFADAWLAKIARGAPERLAEFEMLVERAFKDGEHGRTGRVNV